MTLFAAAVGVAAVAQTDVWVWKDGDAVKMVSADSITFSGANVVRGTEPGHEWVDLGLTSGTKWATMNVGATKPEEYGNYYAWGETATKTTYSWSTYLDGNISSELDCGTNKDLLKDVTDIAGTQYDAAKVNWGGKWRMPTTAQQDELGNQCYWVWTNNYNNSNVAGYIVYKAKESSDKGVIVSSSETPSSSYSLSDAHIFLPAAGSRDDGTPYDFDYVGSGGFYCSSSLFTDSDFSISPWIVLFNSGYANLSVGVRYCGQSVRAVISGE